jgi:hypothetical protein
LLRLYSAWLRGLLPLCLLGITHAPAACASAALARVAVGFAWLFFMSGLTLLFVLFM